MKYLIPACFFLLSALSATAHTRQDTLRGSNGRGRDWWDVTKYELQIWLDTANQSIRGSNEIIYKVIAPAKDSMQIDLQADMHLIGTRESTDSSKYHYPRENGVYWIKEKAGFWRTEALYYRLRLEFGGKPAKAINPPWDGGFIWTKDSTGKPWITVACQGLGASSWWPCKDYQGDEPDSGMTIRLRKPKGLTVVANGRHRFGFIEGHHISRIQSNGRISSVWENAPDTLVEFTVRNPINTYNTTFYIGDYAHWHDTLHGEKGILDLDFYPLKYNEAKARKHWAVTKDILRCFEYWMGPYPFYEDGYKLVEAPFLGMEHQSAIAYGNEYKMGYRGKDRSGTGVGLAFDFIIIHESGHEWFGNNITARDVADNWLHEGFTSYTETLFAEWIKGRDSAFAYTTGKWALIKNDRPVIGDYGVHDDGSGDKYDKGAAVVHMIRLMINDDEKFRQLLRGLNRDFYHKIVTSKEVEDYISKFVGRDLKPFFDVYLRSAKTPTLVLWTFTKDRKVHFTWKDANLYFHAPIAISLDAGKTFKVYPQSPDELSYDTYIARRDLRVKSLGLYQIEEREK